MICLITLPRNISTNSLAYSISIMFPIMLRFDTVFIAVDTIATRSYHCELP